jgi:hypothetical protein
LLPHSVCSAPTLSACRRTTASLRSAESICCLALADLSLKVPVGNMRSNCQVARHVQAVCQVSQPWCSRLWVPALTSHTHPQGTTSVLVPFKRGLVRSENAKPTFSQQDVSIQMLQSLCQTRPSQPVRNRSVPFSRAEVLHCTFERTIVNLARTIACLAQYWLSELLATETIPRSLFRVLQLVVMP